MVNCVILVAVLFHSLFVVTRVTAYLEVYEKSCRNSYLARLGDNYFCDIVEWRTAVLYGKNSYSLYETGTSLSAVQQDNVAKTLYDNIRNGNNLSKSCRDALKAFVCVETFPHCPNQGSPKSTVSYFPTCVAQCRQAQSLCGSLSIDCSSYNHANCGFYAKSGYYLPHPTQGPYNASLPFYISILTIWIVVSAVWFFLIVFAFVDTVTKLQVLYFLLLLLKVLVCGLLVAFWNTCVSSGGICSSMLASSVVSAQHFYEGVFAIIALIISKGWCITRVDLAFSEWREIFILSLVFFVLVTLMQVIGNSWNFTDNVWIAVIILYSCLYFFILGNTWRELDLLYAQVAKIHDDRVVNAVTVAVREKFTIFLIILVMIAAMFTAEVLCNYMFSSRNRLVFVYIVYELVSLLVILTIGYFIRPRNLSPFYFVIPVTTNLNTHLRTIANDPMLSTAVNSTKLPPIIRVSKGSRTNRAAGDSANRNSYEIELTGFLSNLNEDEEEGIVVRNRKTKLIVVEHSNSKQISLAVSNNPSNMNGRSENTVESWLAQVRSIFRRIGSGASVSPSE